LITARAPPWIYLATGQAGDDEMAQRIAAHRARRNVGWQTIEVPHDLAGALDAAAAQVPLLVDCVTLWLTNRMLAEADVDAEIVRLEDALARRTGVVVLVSNEVGYGIVPDNALARTFRDAQGRMNQRLAERADRVVLVIAGQPLVVKGSP
jgi:adenosylcobinamide kinase/adenosylcobinamide-phosphate guanylyltransferase